MADPVFITTLLAPSLHPHTIVPMPAPLPRHDALAELARSPLDLLVVGGGIVGAGVARDAAMRGLRVGLVEQADFASGTSSRSSRLLHGGLRYLAQGRVGLVWQAGRERWILRRIAPHLARPLPFIFPSYAGSAWPHWALWSGAKVYDALCANSGEERSRGVDETELLAAAPGLRTGGLAGAVCYFDAMTNDARLVLDTLRSAANHRALLANYTRFQNARHQSGRWLCTVRDVLANQEIPLESRVIVNATGPWANDIPGSALRLRRSKGVHLVIDRDRLPISTAVVMSAGKRILFAIPWSRRVILGTTDTDYPAAPELVRAEPEDIQQILEVVNESFPAAAITASDIRATWAGVRALMNSDRGDEPSDISRAHVIRQNSTGWLDVAGGKLTTYRLIAEHVLDRVVKFLDEDIPPCRTADLPLLTAADEAEFFSAIEPPALAQRHVRHAVGREWAVHLDDVMTRRTGWRYYLANPDSAAEQVSTWMAAELGWDESTRTSELAHYREHK